MNRVAGLVVGCLVLMLAGQASADTIWGNTATFGPVQLGEFDTDTGAKVTEYTVAQTGNGRGIVVVGDTIYWTVVGDPNIYMTDKNTGLPLGSILTTNASMSTIAWDGQNFWTSDYSGTNQAFLIDPNTGLNIDTITLSLAGGGIDGMEFFYDGSDARLIANRGDAVGPYDIYDTDGNLIQAAFITPTFQPTGIAFDGTDFWVSNIFGQAIVQYSGIDGSFIKSVSYAAFSGPFNLIEDLSFDYTITIPDTTATTTNGSAPEPASLFLLGAGLAASACSRRRQKGGTRSER